MYECDICGVPMNWADVTHSRTGLRHKDCRKQPGEGGDVLRSSTYPGTITQ